jgi:L-glutamine-phosphate cytidylyltransferase
MYLVKEYLSDSYVIDADIYMNKNFLLDDPQKSMYFSAYKRNVKNEWKIIKDKNDKVKKIEIMNGVGEGYILSGVSYWSIKEAEIIVDKLEKSVKSEEDFKNLYWDDIARKNIDELSIYIHKLNEEDVFEIDCLEELEEVKSKVEK